MKYFLLRKAYQFARWLVLTTIPNDEPRIYGVATRYPPHGKIKNSELMTYLKQFEEFTE